jgi:hypothetical protein
MNLKSAGLTALAVLALNPQPLPPGQVVRATSGRATSDFRHPFRTNAWVTQELWVASAVSTSNRRRTNV